MKNKILDEAEAFARLDGDRNMFEDLLDLFANSCCDEMVRHVQEALAARDCNLLARACHTFKGALGSISATSAEKAASRAEQTAATGDILAASQAVEELLFEIQRLQKYIEEIRKGSCK